MTKHALPSIQNVRAPLRRTAREAPHAHTLRLATACVALLLSSCGTVEWVKTRFVEPTASAPAPVASGAAVQRAAPAPAPKAEAAAPAAPAVPQPPPPPPARPIPESAPQQAAPLPPMQPAPAPPAPAAVAAQPAPRVALAAPAAVGDLAPGRWAVQVGVFFGANPAEAVRARVAAQLAQSDVPAESRATRVIKRDNKYFVVVGEAADQRAAEALANRVRAALKQDVALFRR
jgi:cell division protein FtsN